MAEVERCPHCRAALKMRDTIWIHGFPVVSDYCGACGLTWPQDGRPTEGREEMKLRGIAEHRAERLKAKQEAEQDAR